MRQPRIRRNRAPESYIARRYRTLAGGKDLVSSLVQVKETDLHLLADRDVTARATELVLQCRQQIESYIQGHEGFTAALLPLPEDILAPPPVKMMLEAGRAAGVGPMAAVAGTLSEYVGRQLVEDGAREVVVENGGDIYLFRKQECTVAIFAGESPLSYRAGIRLPQTMMPCGVCTSSGTVGHSLSFGRADSVTVLAGSTPLADAVATRLGNEVGEKGGKAGLEKALRVARTIPGISGVVIICNELIGAVGDIELVRL